ncbi:hypothetical protein ABPG75_006107 [Micractinium tetrahymenae]
MAGIGSEVLTVNVGGTLFTTTRTTLKMRPGMLANMFGGGMGPGLTDEEGHPFINRSPKHFSRILDYLRTGRVVLPLSLVELEELLAEAEFYALDQLAKRTQQALEDCREAVSQLIKGPAKAHAEHVGARRLAVDLPLPPRGPAEPNFFESCTDARVKAATSTAAVAAALQAVERIQGRMREGGLGKAASMARKIERGAARKVQRRLQRVRQGPAARELLDIAFGRR